MGRQRQRQRQRQPSAQPADAPHGLAWRARDADGVGAQVVLLRHSYYRRHTPKDEGVGVLEEDEPLDPCPHRICHQSLPTPVALQNTRGQGTQTSRRPCIHTPMLVQQCVHIAVAMRLGFYNAVLACARPGTNVKTARCRDMEVRRDSNVKAPRASASSLATAAQRRTLCPLGARRADNTLGLGLVGRAARTPLVSLCRGCSTLLTPLDSS